MWFQYQCPPGTRGQELRAACFLGILAVAFHTTALVNPHLLEYQKTQVAKQRFVWTGDLSGNLFLRYADTFVNRRTFSICNDHFQLPWEYDKSKLRPQLWNTLLSLMWLCSALMPFPRLFQCCKSCALTMGDGHCDYRDCAVSEKRPLPWQPNATKAFSTFFHYYPFVFSQSKGVGKSLGNGET